MPILIRLIAQRVFLVVLSSLSVLGLSSQTEIKTEETTTETPTIFEEEKEIFENISFPIPKTNILNIPKITSPLPEIKQNSTKTEAPTPQKTPVAVSEEKIETKPIEVQIPDDNSSLSSIENVLVNIQCLRKMGNSISLSNGSGVLISSSGVVLTNAHVAQNFLLKDSGFDCTIRQENIPLYGFTAEPLYISENWIGENYHQVRSNSPTGTGRYDYALLLITGSTNSVMPLPKFPSLKINTSNEFLDAGDKITIAGYPGVLSSSLEIAKNTSLKIDTVTVKDVFTLEKNSVDVVGTTDTSVARRGSSGGGAFKKNELGGIIVSTNEGSNPTKSVVNILTLSYINREIKNETGKNLASFLSGDLMKQLEDFATVAPRLTELLTRNL